MHQQCQNPVDTHEHDIDVPSVSMSLCLSHHLTLTYQEPRLAAFPPLSLLVLVLSAS